MNLTKRILSLVALLALLVAPVSALAKTGKSAKAVKPAAATTNPQSGCDQDCNQALFDGIDNCNTLHYLDPSEGLYAECVSLAQRNWALCKTFCGIGGILGLHRRQPKSAAGIRGFVRLAE